MSFSAFRLSSMPRESFSQDLLGSDAADSPCSLAPVPLPRACVQKLLAEHGVVCVSRTGADAARLLDAPGSLLQRYRQNVTVVEEPVPNEISSSRVRPAPWRQADRTAHSFSHHSRALPAAPSPPPPPLHSSPRRLRPPAPCSPCPCLQVRHELERGHSVRYLLPDSVASYIYAHRLYNTSERRPRILHLGEQKVDRDTDM